MYSFSHAAKCEAAKINLADDLENIAELSAVIHAGGSVSLGKEMKIEISTEIEPLYSRINLILKRLYNSYAELYTDDDLSINKHIRYIITILPEIAKEVLFDCELLRISQTGNTEFVSGIENMLIIEESAARAYVRGVFLACSTSSITLNDVHFSEHSGYHMEFLFTNETLADDFAQLLTRFEIFAKKIVRKGSYVVYLKDAQSISDVLALVGVNDAVLSFNEQVMMREVKNNINRQNNCINYNMNKTVNAAVEQAEAIKVIDSLVGLSSLPLELSKLAKLRLEMPDATLSELAEVMDGKLSKSGIRHRFNKIITIAKNLLN